MEHFGGHALIFLVFVTYSMGYNYRGGGPWAALQSILCLPCANKHYRLVWKEMLCAILYNLCALALALATVCMANTKHKLPTVQTKLC